MPPVVASKAVHSSGRLPFKHQAPPRPLTVQQVRLACGGKRDYIVLSDSPEPAEGTLHKKQKTSQTVVAPKAPPPANVKKNRPKQRKAIPAPRVSSDGHYIFEEGEILHEKYRVSHRLGSGTYAKVVSAVQKESNKVYAVKIIRAAQLYRAASVKEIEILAEIKKRDPMAQKHCIHLFDRFEVRDHVCLVFPQLGISIYDYLRKTGFSPIPLPHIQTMGRQLLTAVAFLHKLKIIHTDLKPENILLLESSYDPALATDPGLGELSLRVPLIRLIDFGSAIFETGFHAPVISTRLYRAPEVVLELGWSYPCDLFSAGLVLLEMFTGSVVFETNTDGEHVEMMEIFLGPMPVSFLRRIANRHPTKFKRGRLSLPVAPLYLRNPELLQAMATLEDTVPPLSFQHSHFGHLIRHLLHFEPQLRFEAAGSLTHEFFSSK